jgi:hypothetical protein
MNTVASLLANVHSELGAPLRDQLVASRCFTFARRTHESASVCAGPSAAVIIASTLLTVPSESFTPSTSWSRPDVLRRLR